MVGGRVLIFMLLIGMLTEPIIGFDVFGLGGYLNPTKNDSKGIIQDGERVGRINVYQAGKSLLHRVLGYNYRQAYPGIEIVLDNIEYISDVLSDWHNLTYRFRVPIWLNETQGIDRANQLITIDMNFAYGTSYNESIRVIDNSTGQIVMFQVWNESYYPNSEYIQEAYISWITNLSAYESKLYYIYWSNVDIGPYPRFTSDLSVSEQANEISISNHYYNLSFLRGKAVRMFVDEEEISSYYSFSSTPFVTHPYNATYVIIDRVEDVGSSFDADHLKIIAWEDNTYVELYGYDPNLGEFVSIENRTLDKNQLWRYPDEGAISTYSIMKVVSTKPVTIISGDLGSIMTGDAYGDEATARIQWGVDHGSDDDLFTYYGQDIVLWVPRDLWISAYFDDTHIKIIDISDGDDNYEFTLDANEHWILFYGINISAYLLDTQYYFDNDIVRIIADKPITVVGGYLDDNIYGEIRGYAQKKFVFPVFRDFAICAIEDNTKIDIWVKNLHNGTEWIYNITLNSGEGQQFIHFTNLRDDTGGYWGYINIDEIAKAIVIADKPIVVFTGADRSTGGAWGGEGEYVGQYFAYVSTFKPRFVRAVALEPNTKVEIYLNGTLSDTVVLTNVGDSKVWNIAAGQGVIIKSNRSIVTKIFGGWYNPTPSEDVFLLVNMLPMRISAWQIYTIGPVLVKLEVVWETQQFLQVEEEYTFWAYSPRIRFMRRFWKPELMEINGSIFLMDLNVKYIFDSQNINGANYSSRQNVWIINDCNFYVSYWNSTGTNVSIGLGITNITIVGHGSIDFISSVSGWFKETHSIHLTIGWNTSIYLAGGSENKIMLAGYITLGDFGANIISETSNAYNCEEYPILVTLGPSQNTSCMVIVNVTNDDPLPKPMKDVQMNLSSIRHSFSSTGLTNSSGILVIRDVPASDDYNLEAYWTNNSPIFVEFPGAHTTLSLSILGSVKIFLRVKVRTLYVNITNVDGKPLTGAHVQLIGNFSNEVVVNTTRFVTQSGLVVMTHMPLGTSSVPINYTAYIWYNSTCTLWPIERSNNSWIGWYSDPSEYFIDIAIAVTNLTVRVESMDGVGIPGASVAIRNGTTGDIFASKSTDMSNKTVFEDIPTGVGYVFEVRYAGYSNTSYQTDVLSEKYVVIKLPFVYGQTPLLVFLDKDQYTATVGSTLRIFIEVKANYTNDSSWWLENVEPDAIWVDIVNATNLSDYRVQNAIPVGLGNGSYYYDIELTEDLYPKAGDFRIHVWVRKIAFMPGDNYSIMHVIVPITTRIEDYGDEREYWGANYTVWITLTDKSTGTPIVDANVKARILKDSTVYRTLNLTHVGNGTYKAWTILDGNISVGEYQVNVSIERPSEELFTIFPLSIETVPTDYIYSAYSTVEFYDNFTVNIRYRRIDPHRISDYVSGAIVTYYVINATSGERVYPSSGVLYGMEYQPGKYNISFNASVLGVEGDYKIYINVTRIYYQKQEISMLFTVIKVKTRAAPTVGEVSVEYGEEVIIKVYYLTLEDVSIPDANATLEITGVSFNYDVTYNATNGYYVFNFSSNQSGFEIGTYSIVAKMDKEHYEPAMCVITLNILPISTKLIPSSYEYSVYYGENITIEVFYATMDGVPIKNAEYNISITGVPLFVYYSSYNESTGKYIFIIPTNQTAFEIGTYIAEIKFNKTYYTAQSTIVKLIINTIPTKLLPSQSEIHVYYGDNVSFYVLYLTMDDDPIKNATFEITITGVPSFYYTWYYNNSMNAYVFVIPSNQSAFDIGTYVLNMTFSKAYYEAKTVLIKMVINPIPTRIVPSTREIWVYYGMNVCFYVIYETINGEKIHNATVLLEVIGYPNISYIIYYDEALGAYVFSFSTSEVNLTEGYYTLRVTASKTYYEPQVITIELTINPIETLLFYIDTYTMYVDEDLVIAITYYDDVNDEYIPGGLLYYSIQNLSKVTIYSGTVSSDNGTYIIYIEEMSLLPGTYLIAFNVTKEHYVMMAGQITLSVKKVAISIAYDETLNMTWSENRTILFNVISERGEKPEGIAINATLYDESLAIVMTLLCIDQGDGTYSVYVDSWNLTPGSTYYLYVYFGSDIYAEEVAIVTIYVDYLEIYLRYEETSYSVKKNPITGGATSIITIGIFYENGLPVSNASVIYELICGGEIIETGHLEEYDPEMDPGKYRVTIKWGDKPPDTYMLRIRIESLYIRGKRVDASSVVKPVTLGVHKDLEISFDVDYIFGTITIFGKKMPVVIVVPMLVAIIGGGVFLAYRWYLWYILPWEVKELIRILNNIEKGIWAYEAPERSQYIMEIISQELAVETESS